MTASTMVRTDEEIQRDVIAELKWDARIAPNEIGVIVTNGVVTLTGWVDSYNKKWAAERAAHRVRGVKAVANDIEVRMPSSAEKPDPEIAAAVTRALEWDAFVPIENLDVTVAKGWVTIRGDVEWEFQRIHQHDGKSGTERERTNHQAAFPDGNRRSGVSARSAD